MDDFEHLRRLSEAGVSRRMSSELVLTADTDSFMVGETVYVGGTLPGKIAYIGETMFGSGDWAGVALERPYGKHDGTVGGHQYFQCEPRHGVFARLTRLTRESLGSPPPEPRDSSSAERSLPGSRRTSRTSPGTVLPPSGRRSSSPDKKVPGGRRSSSPGKPDDPRRISLARLDAGEPRRVSVGRDGGEPRRVSVGRNEGEPRRTSVGRNDGEPRRTSVGRDEPHQRRISQGREDEQRKLSTGKGRAWNSNGSYHSEHTTPRPGDRVSVTSSVGKKMGTARYIGHADFADGIWIGIALDEPNGRNDGSVAGKRYFECRPSYGLFAPLHRVTLVQRRPSGDLDRRRSHNEFQRELGGADIDGYY